MSIHSISVGDNLNIDYIPRPRSESCTPLFGQ
jgi:hypothetical protein